MGPRRESVGNVSRSGHCFQDDASPTCRFCYEQQLDGPDGKLIRPCVCKGTLAHVHVECLRKWLQHELYSGKDLDKITVCNLCTHRYNVRLALCEGREQASCLPQPNPEGLEQSALVLGRTRQRCPLANPRRPIIAGRDPQEVLHDFLVLVKESPFSTLITAWKLLVFMTAAANSIAGGLWGMGKGFQVGLWLVKFAVKYLLPSDARAYCRASSPVRQIDSVSNHPMLTLVAMMEIIIAVAAGAYAGLILGFCGGVLLSLKASGFIASQTLTWGSLFLAKGVQIGSFMLKRLF